MYCQKLVNCEVILIVMNVSILLINSNDAYAFKFGGAMMMDTKPLLGFIWF
jgi:hypothetical protein